jgi:hypothetical protein
VRDDLVGVTVHRENVDADLPQIIRPIVVDERGHGLAEALHLIAKRRAV